MTHVELVREVQLHGDVDLAYWRDFLAGINLAPLNCDGKAQMQLTVAEKRFTGGTFNVFTITVLVASTPADPSAPGYYLAHAYNTSSVFALMERLIYKTPYFTGAIDLKDTVPVSFALRDGNDVVLSAMCCGAAQPVKPGEDIESAVYVPSRPGHNEVAKGYAANQSITTVTWPFGLSDTFRVQSPRTHHALQMLVDAHFRPQFWRVQSRINRQGSETNATVLALV
jgi:hypothetical protein